MYFPCCRILEKDCIYWESRSRHVWYNVDAGGERPRINIDNLVTDDTVHTTLAFVHTGVDGDRDFSFYRNPGADMMLREEEIQQEIFADTKIFHFGTLSMTDLADKMWYGISQCDILKISDDEISMREIEIMLSSIEDVKHFVQTITMFDGEFELVSGKYIVDAKYIENLQ